MFCFFVFAFVSYSSFGYTFGIYYFRYYPDTPSKQLYIT